MIFDRSWYNRARVKRVMGFTDTKQVRRFLDKRRAHLNIMTHLLSKIPYKSVKREKIKLPRRQSRGSYREPDQPIRYVDEAY